LLFTWMARVAIAITAGDLRHAKVSRQIGP
jgi:hypothetical protein